MTGSEINSTDLVENGKVDRLAFSSEIVKDGGVPASSIYRRVVRKDNEVSEIGDRRLGATEHGVQNQSETMSEFFGSPKSGSEIRGAVPNCLIGGHVMELSVRQRGAVLDCLMGGHVVGVSGRQGGGVGSENRGDVSDCLMEGHVVGVSGRQSSDCLMEGLVVEVNGKQCGDGPDRTLGDREVEVGSKVAKTGSRSPKCDTDNSIVAAQVISGAAEAIKGMRDPFSDLDGSTPTEKNPALGDLGLGRPLTSSGRKGEHERKGVV